MNSSTRTPASSNASTMRRVPNAVASSRPRAHRVGRGGGDVGVDVADSNCYARRQSGQLRGLRGQPAGEAAERGQRVVELRDEVAERRIQSLEVLPGRVTVVGVDALVAG